MADMRGRSRHSTKEKPFAEQTPGSRRGAKAREKKIRLKKDGTPDKRYKVDPKAVASDDLIKLPEDLDELDKKHKQELYRAKKLENDRLENQTLYRKEVDQEIIRLMDAFQDGVSNLSDKWKQFRPDAAPEDMVAAQKLEAHIINHVKNAVFNE